VELEVLIAAIAAFAGGLLVWFLKKPKKDVTPAPKTPDVGPVADAGHDSISEISDREFGEVEDTTSDPTPPTEGGGLASISDSRRRRRRTGGD
jgi:hypothetical protein